MAGRSLYVRPLNGLCNRMRALASARALALKTGADLKVVWLVDSGLAAAYEDIFLPVERMEVLNIIPTRSFADRLRFVLFGEVERMRGAPVAWITKLFFRRQILRQVRPEDYDDAELERRVLGARRLLVTSWWTFYGEPNLDFSFFKPRPVEQKEIDQFSAAFDPQTIGIHIRRTDNVNAIKHSPDDAFIAVMEDCVREDPSVNFFLATDSADTEAKLKAKFGARLVTRPRSMTRDSVQGIKDAVIDLWLLSRTSRILGSYYSTFSETAASIGSIEWATVTDNPALVCNSPIVLPKGAPPQA